MASTVKSKTTSEFFSHTMSRCDCRASGAAFSRPGVAGTRTTTLPAASVAAVRLRAAATARTYWRIPSSFLEPRGMARIWSKWRQSAVGSSARTKVAEKLLGVDMAPF